MLMRRSAPQPAMKKTPRGGTGRGVSHGRTTTAQLIEDSLKMVMMMRRMAEIMLACLVVGSLVGVGNSIGLEVGSLVLSSSRL